MITLLVPTMNRSEFVSRLLDYYAAANFTGRILIGDSSRPEHVLQIKERIAAHAGKLRVDFHHFPGLSLGACYKAMSALVQTPYVVPAPDDDYIVPRAIDRCIEFLEKNPSYVGAHGSALTFMLDRSGPTGVLERVGPYDLHGFEAETPVQRIQDFFRNYSVTVFAVHRTAAWRTMWNPCDAIHDVPIASELLPCATSVILGKIKEFPFFYLARQVHDLRYVTANRFETIIGAHWTPSINALIDRLAEQLHQADRIPLKHAVDVVKRELWLYFGTMLVYKWDITFGKKSGLSVIRKKVFNRIRSLSMSRRFSLSALRRKSSPDYQDFQLIESTLKPQLFASGRVDKVGYHQ